MNIFDSVVSFVTVIRTQGLETKETRTGPTAVGATNTYDTYCYSCTFGVRLVSLTRYGIILKRIIHSLGY